MKKIIKNVTKVICLCACLSVGLTSKPVSASDATWKSRTVNNSNGFEKAWEKTVTYKKDKKTIGKMTYGFDTFAIEEDYVWTKAIDDTYSLAEVERISVDKELQYGSKKAKDKYSKIEVRHKNFHIKYQVKFYKKYSGLSESVKNSSIK